MKKIFFSIIFLTGTYGSIYAQYTADALRFSQTNYGSSARFKAMGNAQTGAGGDISSLGGNPAGLGLFTRSEFSFTPEFNQSIANSNYLNTLDKTTKSVLNINQIGAVFYNPVYKRKGEDLKNGLISMVYGIGYQRNNDYSMENNFMGTNHNTSMADYFAELAGSTLPSSLASGTPERIAYDNYLISYDDIAKNYYPETYADNANGNFQSRNELRAGSVSEFNLSAAANISNQVYIGASIGLLNIRYTSDVQYQEKGKAREYVNDQLTGNTTDYNMIFNQNQVTKGSGINGRIGVIFRAANNLRLGATLQTPSWFLIDDSYTEQLSNSGKVKGTAGSKTYDFSYNLRTPLKGSLGGTYIIGNQALLSADVDFVDYSGIRFSSVDGGDQGVIHDNNTTVRNSFKGAVNYRIGLEYKLDAAISLRGGYGLNGSPYKSDSNGTYDTDVYSAGLGFRNKKYYLDLAYQHVENMNTFSPYTLQTGTQPTATFNDVKNNVFVTFGLRF